MFHFSKKKLCVVCKAQKNLEEYQSDGRGGTRTSCKICTNARRKELKMEKKKPKVLMTKPQKKLPPEPKKHFNGKPKPEKPQAKFLFNGTRKTQEERKPPISQNQVITPMPRSGPEDALTLLDKIRLKHQTFFCLSIDKHGKTRLQIHAEKPIVLKGHDVLALLRAAI